ncbi:MAG: sensor histidine kinase [Bacteroidia bacterium]
MKTRGFFLLLLTFTGACFAWWVIQLERLNRNNLEMQEELLHLRVEQVQNQVLWQGLKDSSAETPLRMQVGSLVFYLSGAQWKNLQNTYPQLELKRDGDYLAIEPREGHLAAVRKKARLTRNRQIAESSLFFSLLFIGFIWIYKGLVQAIDLSVQQSNFLVSITHELKTPIASSRLLFETLVRHPVEAEKVVELSKAGVESSKHQLDLVESLLIASRLENRSLEFPLHRVDLSSWLLKEVELLQRDYQHSLNLELAIEPGVEGLIEDMSLRLSLANLISNARKYAGKESPLFVGLYKKDGNAILQVGDAGPGIPDPEKKRIFKKFYRRGDAKTHVHRGTGLGLFIVAETAKRHKGRVWVEDRKPQGSMFNLLIQSP